jgi:hypothetical protein
VTTTRPAGPELDDAVQGAARAADTFFTAAAQGDVAGFESVTSDATVFWQNTDGRERNRTQVLRHLERLRAAVGTWEYRDVRRLTSADGFCEQHLVVFTAPDGSTTELEACVVARVDASGLITRLDEYVDGSAT